MAKSDFSGPVNVTGSVTPYNTTATVGTQPYACTSNDYRQAGVARIAVTGTTYTSNNSVATWVNPEGKAIIVDRVVLLVQSTSTTTCNVIVGRSTAATAAVATTIIPTASVGTANAPYIAGDSAVSVVSGSVSVYMAATDVIGITNLASGNSQGLAGELYVSYWPI